MYLKRASRCHNSFAADSTCRKITQRYLQYSENAKTIHIATHLRVGFRAYALAILVSEGKKY